MLFWSKIFFCHFPKNKTNDQIKKSRNFFIMHLTLLGKIPRFFIFFKIWQIEEKTHQKNLNIDKYQKFGKKFENFLRKKQKKKKK